MAILKALVIEPRSESWAGGQYISTIVCKSLLERGYTVYLATDDYQPDDAESKYGLGTIIRNCHWVPLPHVFPRLRPLQRTIFLRKVMRSFEKLDPDVTVNTQFSPYLYTGPNLKLSVCYDGDLNYLYHQDSGARGIYYDVIRRMMA